MAIAQVRHDTPGRAYYPAETIRRQKSQRSHALLEMPPVRHRVPTAGAGPRARDVHNRAVSHTSHTAPARWPPARRRGAYAAPLECEHTDSHLNSDLLACGAISDGQLYAAVLPIRTTLPELWPDVRFPPFVDEGKYRAVNFWLGPGNNFTPLHFDASDNFLAQIRGRKQVILCPPREIARLYPFPFSYAANHFSQVNVLSPDLTRFPAWAHADRALLELGPGDMLFIPVYWWHAVWGIEQNMSINYWWRPRPASRLQHPRQTARETTYMAADSGRFAPILRCLSLLGRVS